MKNTPLLPTWASRVKPHKIRRLYESDAQGLLDADLLNEVGWSLYARCESFLQAMEAFRGRARCPACGAIVLHNFSARAILHCTACGWECPWRDYYGTIRNQQLNGGPEVEELFQTYLQRFPKAKEATEKMLLVDQLIHGFHHFLSSGRTRRPVGVNLLDGNLEYVVQFLDQLTYGPASTPGLREAQQTWREKIQRSRRKKKEQGDISGPAEKS